MTDVLVLGVMYGSLYGLLALGIVLVYKTTRVLNFAQGEFGTFATYIAWALIVKADLPWILGLLIALVAIGAIGFVIERVIVRPMLDGPRLSIAVATLGIMSFLGLLEAQIWTFSPQILPGAFSGSMQLGGFVVGVNRLLNLLAAAVVGLGLYLFIKNTTFGLGLLASAHDTQAVRLMGVRLRHLSSFTWTVAAVLGGLAGVLTLSTLGTFQPFAMTVLFVPALAAALLGGLTSIPGSFVGGILIGLVQALLASTFEISGIQEAGLFLVLILILLLRPQGLFGRAA